MGRLPVRVGRLNKWFDPVTTVPTDPPRRFGQLPLPGTRTIPPLVRPATSEPSGGPRLG